MPYRVEQRGDWWHVVKVLAKGRTQSVGKHDTKDKAHRQLAALKINVEDA